MGIQNCKEKCFNKKFSDLNDFNLNQNENFLNYSFDKKNIFNNNFNNENDIKFFIDSFNNNNNKNILNYIKKVELIQKKFREFLLRKNNKNHIKNQIEIISKTKMKISTAKMKISMKISMKQNQHYFTIEQKILFFHPIQKKFHFKTKNFLISIFFQSTKLNINIMVTLQNQTKKK